MTDDGSLLRRYNHDRSEEAFHELVSRNIDLVYSAARRMLGRDSDLARDVTQLVFVDLAQKSLQIPSNAFLPGWLHRHACYTAMKTIRTEQRRRAREKTAVDLNSLHEDPSLVWEEIAPRLDEALNQLSGSDREVLVLRFLKQQDLHAVGLAFGISEDAAQKRVGRALEKLRKLLRPRGLAPTGAALAAALTAEGVTAAPAGLAISITAAASAAFQSPNALVVLKLMAASKAKIALVSALIGASLILPVLLLNRSEAQLRRQQEILRQRAEELLQIESQNQRPKARPARTGFAPELSAGQFSELLRLRGEIGRLRSELRSPAQPLPVLAGTDLLAELESEWTGRANQLKQWLEDNPSAKIPELQLMAESDWINAVYPLRLETEDEYRQAVQLLRSNAEIKVLDRLSSALRQYAKANPGHSPSDVAELSPFLKVPLDPEILQRYQILPANRLVAELRGDDEWVLTQKIPIDEKTDIRYAIGLTEMKSASRNVPNRWNLLP